MASSPSPVTPAQIIDQILSTDTSKPDYLQQLVDNIDNLLHHYTNKGKQKATSVRAGLTSASDVAKFSDEASKSLTQISTQISYYSGDKHSTAISVLNALGKVHWVGVGFLLVAAVVQRLDKITQNKNECLQLLKSMNNLAKIILQLQHLPHLKKELTEKMKESIHLIVDGAILCCVQKQGKGLGRLWVAGTHGEELAKLYSQVDEMIRMLHMQISLSTLHVVQSNIVCSQPPVPSYYSAVVGIDQILSTDTSTPDYLQQLVTNIDTFLYHYTNKGKQKATDDKLASVRAGLPSASQVAKFSEEVSKNVRLISTQISDYSGDKHGTAISVLNALGNIHWAEVGFLLVAAVIERLDKVKQNKEDCLRLLKSMNDLAKLILQLQRLPHLQTEMNEKMKESIQLIVDGAILCCVQNKRKLTGRLLGAGTDRQELAKLRIQVDEMVRMLHSQISLSTLNVVHSNLVVSQPPVPSHDSAVVGIDHKINEVIELLEWDNDTPAVAVVVHGIGGAGKTTLANEVFASLNLQGWKYSKVTLIKNMESNPNIEEIQTQILSDLTGIKHDTVRDFHEGQQQMKSIIEKEIVFIYIDNILWKEHLEKLLPKLIDSSPQKVRILVTARKTTISGVFKRCGIELCKLYSIESLSVEAAVQLLCRRIDSKRDMDSLVEERPQAKKIAEKCRCCPLILEVVGGYLHKENNKAEAYEKVWVWLTDGEDFSYDKEDCFEESRILSAYNELETSAREAFLDICSFFRNWEWNEVACIVGEEELDCLLEGGLVKRIEVESYDKTKVERINIHDLILTAGRNKSKGNRYTNVDDFSIAMENEGDLHQTKGVWLEYNYEPFHVSAEVLDTMSRSLRVLAMGKNTTVSGQCSKRFDELRFLEAYKVPNLVIDILKLKNLRFMDYCFEENEIWSLPKNFSGLQVLKLKRSSGTDRGNMHADIEFGHLIKLKHLELEGFHITEVSSFVKVYGLQKLKLSSIEGLMELPGSIGKLRSLQELHLFACDDLMQLGEGFGDLSSLTVFYLSSCKCLQELPCDLKKLLSLQSLILSYCSNLLRLPEELENLPSLRFVDVRGCSKLTSLLHRVCELIFQKREISLSGCKSLKVLPIGFGQFSCLESLWLNDCESLKELCDDFHCLKGLKRLNISGCKSLSKLPDSFGQLSYLESLNLSGCDNIQELCSDFGCLGALKYLDLSKCKSLPKLSDCFGQLGCLESLNLSGCDNIHELCSDFGCLGALKYLDLSKCKSLSKLPDCFGQLGYLESLNLSECDNIEELCSDFGCLGALKFLDLFKCKTLSKLPDRFGQLGCLEDLELSGCDNIQELCSDFGCLGALKYLDMSKCKSLSKLPDCFGQLGCLESLNLSGCDNIQELCSDFGCLGALKDLDLSKCKSLSKLPDCFGQLGCLERLNLSMCSKLEELSSNFHCLTSLMELVLSNCESLGEKWMDKVGSIQSLWRINISRSEKMTGRWIEMQREKEDWSFVVLTDFSWEDTEEGRKALLLKVATSKIFDEEGLLIDIHGSPFYSSSLPPASSLVFIIEGDEHSRCQIDGNLLEKNMQQLDLNSRAWSIIYAGRHFSALPSEVKDRIVAYTPSSSKTDLFFDKMSATFPEIYGIYTYVFRSRVGLEDTPAQIIDHILSTDKSMPDYLKNLVDNIDNLLHHYNNKGKQTATDDNLASVGAEHLKSSDVAKFSDEASKSVTQISTQISDYSGDKHSTSISVLNALGNVDWVGVGFLLVAAVVEKLDKIKQNKNECIQLLKSMNDLAKLILQLQRFPHLKKELNDEVKESIRLIVDGAISCCELERLLGAGTDGQELEKLRSQVDEMGRMLHKQISSQRPVPSHNSADWQRQMELIDSFTSTARQNEKIVPQLSPPFSIISRVPQDLRALHPKAYNPMKMGLGIYHHEMNPYSSQMVDYKLRALGTTATRLECTAKNLVAEIQKLDLQIRNCYTDNRDSLSEEILPWKFAMDACFILEYFRSFYWFSKHISVKEIMIDIFKLENQIPLFILLRILELEFQTLEKAISMLANILCRKARVAILPFSLKQMELRDLQAEIEANIKEGTFHLLHLLSKTIEAFLRPSTISMGDTVVDKDVDIVQGLPITFKPSTDGQVRFEKRWFRSSVLYLPQIYLSEETEPLFWNLIAFAIGSENIIGHFIFFMKCIICSNSKSIAMLREEQIIISKKSDEKIHSMFKNLSNKSESCGPFENVWSQIREHCSSPSNKWINHSMLWLVCLPILIAIIGFVIKW